MSVNSRIVARFGRLSIELDRVRAAHQLAEHALVQHDQRVDEWLAVNLLRDPNDADFINYLHKEQKDDASNGYPQVLRTALFVTGYGVLAIFLTGLCREIEKHVTGPGLSELRGEGIQRARTYLVKVACIACPDSSEWNRLLLYGKLRNGIVHAQGDWVASANIDAIRTLMKQEKTFAFGDADGKVVLFKACNPTFLAVVDAFADQLHLKLDKFIFAA